MGQQRRFKFVIIIIVSFLLLQPIYTDAYGWGYKKNRDHKPPEIGVYKEIIEEFDAVYADLSGDNVIYLTFDNGYEQGYTEDVLNILKKYNIPATFFVTGHYVQS